MPVYSQNDSIMIDVLQMLTDHDPQGVWVTLTTLKKKYPDQLNDMNPYTMYKSLDKLMNIKSSTLFDFVIPQKKKVKNQYSKYVNGYFIIKRDVAMRHINQAALNKEVPA